MPPSVFVADEQFDHPVETLRWIRLAEAVLSSEGIRGETEVSILYVDEKTITDLNTRFLGKDGSTDVLSFPIDEEPVEGGRSPDSGGTGPGYNPTPDEAPTLLGDVVICPAVAHRNAPDHAGDFEDELALLLVHGLLHLLGLDHEDPEEAEVMEAKERELLGRHYGKVPEGAYATADGSKPSNDGAEAPSGALGAGTSAPGTVRAGEGGEAGAGEGGAGASEGAGEAGDEPPGPGGGPGR